MKKRTRKEQVAKVYVLFPFLISYLPKKFHNKPKGGWRSIGHAATNDAAFSGANMRSMKAAGIG